MGVIVSAAPRCQWGFWLCPWKRLQRTFLAGIVNIKWRILFSLMTLMLKVDNGSTGLVISADNCRRCNQGECFCDLYGYERWNDKAVMIVASGLKDLRERIRRVFPAGPRPLITASPVFIAVFYNELTLCRISYLLFSNSTCRFIVYISIWFHEYLWSVQCTIQHSSH